MHDVSDRILKRIEGRKKLTSQLFLSFPKKISQPYQAFVNHTVQQSKAKSSENSRTKCNYDIPYAVGPAPLTLKTLDPLSAFWGAKGRD